MRKLWMILLATLLAATLAVAQSADKDDHAKQDMKSAGHDVKNAAKKAGHATKRGAEKTRDAITGHRDDAREDNAERHDNDDATAQDRDRRALPQSEGSRDARMDRNAARVHIISGPNVEAGDRSATIRWRTDGVASNDVWLEGGGIRGHRTKYDRFGSRDHAVTFSNLRPNTTYHFIIRERDGDVRQEGSFTTR